MEKTRRATLLNAAAGQKGRRAALVLCGLALVALSLGYAWQRAFVADYNPVNGDFQSYNVFRRILAGQWPYADFANYIGMAPVVVNLPFLLFSGSFSSSLFVTNFTCNLLFSATVFILFWLVCKNLYLSLLVAAVFSKLVSSQLLGAAFGPAAGPYLTGLFTNLYTPSNSMRIARAFWPFLLVAVWVLYARWRGRRGGGFLLAAAPQSRRFCLVLGLVAGAGIPWSNDFGLGAAVAMAVIFVALLARLGLSAKQFLLRLGIFAGALALAFVLCITLITGGRPAAYLQATANVANYQYFYFNGTGGMAPLAYAFTNWRLVLFSLPFAGWLVFCLVQLVRGRISDSQILCGFLALCALLGTWAYTVSGSGYNFTEVLEGYTWLALAAVLARGALWLLRRFTRQLALGALALLLAVAVGFSALGVRNAARQAGAARPGVYVEALGGYSTYEKALAEAAALTGDAPVFSVYATGLEVVKGQFQPTGYDYIIHALGDEAQQAYVEDFEKGKYPFAQTMALDLERWLCAQNWYFYRQLVAHYEKVAETEYSWIWQRTEEPLSIETGAAVRFWENEDGSWTVEVRAGDAQDFTADVWISYETQFTSAAGAALSLGRRMVSMSSPGLFAGKGAAANLPASSGGLYIPVGVSGGVGTARLAPLDSGCTALQLLDARVERGLPQLSLWMDEETA